MLTFIIRNFFVLIIALYTFYKLLNIKIPIKQMHVFYILYSIIISISAASCFLTMPSLNWLFILICFILVIKQITKLPWNIAYVNSLFAFALSFASFCLSTIISAFIFSSFYYGNYQIPLLIIRIFVGIIQFTLLYLCFRVPRLKKGMTFLRHIPLNNIGSMLCLFLVILFIIFSQAQTTLESFASAFSIFILFLGLLLIYWWNYHITQTYRKFLRKNEVDSLTLLLEEKNQKIIYLKNENDKLARIIHKDNKIIPALSMAIINSYENNIELDLSELNADSTLHMKLKQLYLERQETLEKYQKEIMHLPQAAFNSVNAILSYMQTESLKANIPYQVVLFDNLLSTIPSEIIEEDFTHLLGDLLTNAINACKDVSAASIQIYLGKIDGISAIKICNTGKIFDMDVLQNLGIIRHTTHANDGSSGIGLMDIWEIKQRYAASLLIEETVDINSSSSQTCINILFNHKNHYIIQSNRHKKLSTYINRPDVMVISKE